MITTLVTQLNDQSDLELLEKVCLQTIPRVISNKNRILATVSQIRKKSYLHQLREILIIKRIPLFANTVEPCNFIISKTYC